MSLLPAAPQMREAEIAAEVERVRACYPGPSNYRDQMSALLDSLFFKFGERVGANRLVALLAKDGRSPSASTAQDEINKFWERVRSKYATRVHRPGLPPALADLVATMTEQIWESALAEAQAALTAERDAAADLVLKAKGEVAEAAEAAALAQAGAEQALQKLQLANDAREALGRDLAAERARLQAAQAAVDTMAERLAREERARQEESSRTQAALDKMKVALDTAVDEQRRLLAIGDDFKQQAARDRAARAKSEEARSQLAADLARLQAELSQVAAQRGMLEGRTVEQAAQIAQLLEQLRAREPGAPARRKLAKPRMRPLKQTKLR